MEQKIRSNNFLVFIKAGRFCFINTVTTRDKLHKKHSQGSTLRLKLLGFKTFTHTGMSEGYNIITATVLVK